MPNHDRLDRDTLIRLLQWRDAERQLGLVWERDELEAERALNDDFIYLRRPGGKPDDGGAFDVARMRR